MKHEKDIKSLIDIIDEARIHSGALFEQFANDKDYNIALLFEMVRETMRQTSRVLDDLIAVSRIGQGGSTDDHE